MKMLHRFGIQCVTILTFAGLAACADTSRKAEENLNLLRLKTLALDSIITVESERLKILDSSINSELRKAGKLDSMINVESLRIDSLVNKVYKGIRQKQ
jgi:hypothetical protein